MKDSNLTTRWSGTIDWSLEVFYAIGDCGLGERSGGSGLTWSRRGDGDANARKGYTKWFRNWTRLDYRFRSSLVESSRVEEKERRMGYNSFLNSGRSASNKSRIRIIT